MSVQSVIIDDENPHEIADVDLYREQLIILNEYPNDTRYLVLIQFVLVIISIINQIWWNNCVLKIVIYSTFGIILLYLICYLVVIQCCLEKMARRRIHRRRVIGS